jgi:uncharacterized protein YkwD
VLPPGKSLLIILAILLCASLAAVAPTGVTASEGRRAAAHVTRASHTRAGCAARSARARRRARPAARSCHASARRARRVLHARPRKARVETTVETPTSKSAAGHRDSVQESAAKIAEVLATPCQNTELTPEAQNIALVRAAVLCLVNQERAQNGRTPLTINPRLERAAEGHCVELVAEDYFAHVSPSGETPVQRIAATGYVPSPADGYAIGENLAWGTLSLSTPKAIVAAWIASPEHLANILESQYTETGIGVTPAVPTSLGKGQPGASYAQEFGVIIR